MYLVHAQQYAAEALLGTGRHAEAEAHLRDVIAMADSAIARDRRSSLRAKRGLIRAALARRDLDTAAALLTETTKQLESIDLPGERAALLLRRGRKNAEALARLAAAIKERRKAVLARIAPLLVSGRRGGWKPVLLVIAGPNGAGKTPLTERLRQDRWSKGVEYLNLLR
jgi:tetratricopeptide (TPR) repeat protein